MTTAHQKGLVRAVARTLIATTAVVLAVLALEVGARAYAAMTENERGMIFDQELGWRPVPNARKRGGVWGVLRPASSNSHGWRDPERPYAKPPNVRRVVAIGDSFTFGVDADDGERWTDVLRQLEERFDVVNLGVAGYGPDQELRVLELEAFKYAPDALVLQFCVLNDLTDLGYERIFSWPKPTFTLADGRLVLRRPEPSWDVRLRNVSYLSEFVAQRIATIHESPRIVAGFDRVVASTLFEAIVLRMVAVASARGVPLVSVLAYAPEGRQPDSRDIAGLMRVALNRAGVPIIDVRDLFASASPNPAEELFSPVGQHWNAAGNELVSRAVQRLLRDLGAF